jgi:hypothetical protein
MADEFRFDADEFEDDEEDGDDVFKQDIVMFMVDYGLIDVDGSSDLFQATIGNIAEFCKAKAISAPKDFVGVCLYRIDSNENPQSVEGVRLIQPLAQVSVESILQLESLATSQSALETLGMPLNDNGISLPNALWICGHAFLDTKRKQAYKRLMMFTADDDPHRNSSGHAMATKSRLRVCVL